FIGSRQQVGLFPIESTDTTLIPIFNPTDSFDRN
ncbi:unnamed protein product, partial [Arabidopsis halleri]